MLSASVTLLAREPQSSISPFLHGHFIEHLGELVYPGLWVGPDSPIPNQRGLRADVLDALRDLAPPVLRWPGGCFADAYDWCDGVGPRETRPTRVTSRWGGDEIETNAFGTHEFMDLCREIGAEPWLAANVGSGTPRELAHWVEYCNFPGGTTISDARAKNGDSEPFGVKFWGIGNENWDCGGKFSAADYAREYRRFESNFPRYQNQEPLLIGCGPDGNKRAESARWTREFLEELERARRPRLDGWDAHFYTWNTGKQFGSATQFTLDEYYGLLQESLKIGNLIDEQRAILDASLIGRDAHLILGEWGIWHAPESADVPLLYQPNTLRDAISAAMTLDVFHEKSGKIAVAALAQTVNVLQSLLQTRGEQIIKTPTYHVFSLYRGHRGGQLLPSQWESGEAGGLPRLSGSASIKNGVVTLTIVNTGARSPVEATVALPSMTIGSASARQMSASALSACNTFEDPETLSPQTVEVQVQDDNLIIALPPASVTAISIKLAS